METFSISDGHFDDNHIYLFITPSTKLSIYYDLHYYDLPLFPFIFKPKQIVVFYWG